MIWGENPLYSETSLSSLEKTEPSILGGRVDTKKAERIGWLMQVVMGTSYCHSVFVAGTSRVNTHLYGQK